MNSKAELELMRLRQDHEQIRRQVARFEWRLNMFESQFLDQPVADPERVEEPVSREVPPPLPGPVIQPAASAQANVSEAVTVEPATGHSAPRPPQTESQPEPGLQPANLEMKLATYWFVRIGVMLLLTGLAFFGYFAYQHVVPQLNEWGKLGAIGFMGGLLVGGGLWCERSSEKERLRTFGRVIFGGGLATFYFMLYAAYHIPHLQVIANPVVDGLLLFGWAGLIAWMADRRRSEVLALFAIGMSYYTSGVSDLGIFTLVSNLILTTAAVFFLVRHRWAALTSASMVGAYIGYAVWRFHQQAGIGAEQLWLGIACLGGSWLALTVGAFTRRIPDLEPVKRAALLLLNNALFCASAGITLYQFGRENLWWFLLLCGGVCTVLSVLATRTLQEETEVRQWLLGQGVLLVTLGLIEHFSGVTLGLILCMEAFVLMLLGQSQNVRLLRAAAYVVGFIGTLSAMEGMQLNNWDRAIPALFSGGLLAAVGWLVRRFYDDDRWLETKVTLWSGAALAVWFEVIRLNVDLVHRPVVLGATALVLALTLPVHRVKPLAALAQVYLLVGQWIWLAQDRSIFPGWTILVLVGMTCALAQWWQRQDEDEGSRFPLALLAMMALLMGIAWLRREWELDQRILVTALVAMMTTAYGVVTRWWALAVAGQVVLGYLGIQFLLGMGKLDDMRNLVPVLSFALFGGAVQVWMANWKEDDRKGFHWLASLYHVLAALMAIIWIHQYVSLREHVWIQMALSFAVFLFGWRFRKRGALLLAGMFAFVALFDFWCQKGAPHIYWANLAAILAPLLMQQMLRRTTEELPVAEGWHLAAGLGSGLSLWLYVSEWAEPRMLTASWTALAFLFLAGGLVVKERAWRWLALTMLTCAIGRALFVDVWKLGVLYRVLSFMALGVTLIVLGFIYTRYQEKIKKWL